MKKFLLVIIGLGMHSALYAPYHGYEDMRTDEQKVRDRHPFLYKTITAYKLPQELYLNAGLSWDSNPRTVRNLRSLCFQIMNVNSSLSSSNPDDMLIHQYAYGNRSRKPSSLTKCLKLIRRVGDRHSWEPALMQKVMGQVTVAYREQEKLAQAKQHIVNPLSSTID